MGTSVSSVGGTTGHWWPQWTLNTRCGRAVNEGSRSFYRTTRRRPYWELSPGNVKLRRFVDRCSAERHGHGGHHHQDQKQGGQRQQTPEWVRRLDSYINVICSKFNDFLFDLKQQTYLGNISFSIWKSAVVVAKLYSYSGGPDNLDTSLCSELFTISKLVTDTCAGSIIGVWSHQYRGSCLQVAKWSEYPGLGAGWPVARLQTQSPSIPT